MNIHHNLRHEAELMIAVLISDYYDQYCKKDTANVETIDAIYVEDIAPWITDFSDPEDDELCAHESEIASKYATAWLANNGLGELKKEMRPGEHETKADYNRARKALSAFIEEQIRIDFGTREALNYWEADNAWLGI